MHELPRCAPVRPPRALPVQETPGGLGGMKRLSVFFAGWLAVFGISSGLVPSPFREPLEEKKKLLVEGTIE